MSPPPPKTMQQPTIYHQKAKLQQVAIKHVDWLGAQA